MLGHWYTLLLRRISGPPDDTTAVEYVRLASAICTQVDAASAIARSVGAASTLTTALTLQSATDIEVVTP